MNAPCRLKNGCDHLTARSLGLPPFRQKKAKGWVTGPLGLCWRLKCSVPHPFRFFLRKGWETTKAISIKAYAKPPHSAAQSVHSAPPQRVAKAHSSCHRRAAAKYAHRHG